MNSMDGLNLPSRYQQVNDIINALRYRGCSEDDICVLLFLNFKIRRSSPNITWNIDHNVQKLLDKFNLTFPIDDCVLEQEKQSSISF